MCEFLSAIVLANGEIVCNPVVDSHSVLIDVFAARYPQLRSDSPINEDRAAFIRVEFAPPNRNYDKPELYKLRVDESFRPGWFDEDMEAQTISRLQDIVKRMVVSNNSQTVIEGCWIVAAGGSLTMYAGARAMAMDNSSVEAMGNSSVKAMGNSSVKAMGNSSVEAVAGSFNNPTIVRK